MPPIRSSYLSPISLLAVSLKRERERLNLSVSELSKRAGIAKSTLSQIESGIGNPSLETLWALAAALNVQVTRLIAQPTTQIQIIRAGEGAALSASQADYTATLLAVCPSGAQRDVCHLAVQPGSVHRSEPHLPGTLEHIVVCSGRARVGPASHPVELSQGDYASYSAEAPHVFEALESNTAAVLLIEQA